MIWPEAKNNAKDDTKKIPDNISVCPKQRAKEMASLEESDGDPEGGGGSEATLPDPQPVAPSQTTKQKVRKIEKGGTYIAVHAKKISGSQTSCLLFVCIMSPGRRPSSQKMLTTRRSHFGLHYRTESLSATLSKHVRFTRLTTNGIISG